MNVEKISNIIQNEIVDFPEKYNDLKEYFITPESVQVTTLNGNKIVLWKIFKKDEYFIMYSDQRDIFGLAFSNIMKELIYLGGNGKLIDVIEAYIQREEI